jgi:hypothetical protein
MARAGGNPDLKGNENSGRKRVYEEHNKANAINKLWEKVNKKVMEGEDLTDFEKELVKSILPKTIKTEQEVSHFLPKPIDDVLSENNSIQEDKGDEEASEGSAGRN